MVDFFSRKARITTALVVVVLAFASTVGLAVRGPTASTTASALPSTTPIVSDAAPQRFGQANFAFPVGPANGDLDGSYPNPIVAGLQGKPLPSLDSGFLEWNGSAWVLNPTALVREPPIDSFSAIRWEFNESSQPYLNSGVGGTMSLTVNSGTACASNKTGLFNAAVICSFSSSEWIESVTSPAVQPGTTAISWWMWVWPYVLNGTNATYMVKEYNAASYVNPFLTIDIQEGASATGSWCCDLTTNGALTQNCVAAGSPEHFLILNQWNFLLCTWDSATGDFAQFHDGSNTGAGSGTATGHNVDYGGGTGRWGICGSTEATGAGNHTCTAFVDDVGIDTTNRCPGATGAGECAWAQQMYQIGVYGSQN